MNLVLIHYVFARMTLLVALVLVTATSLASAVTFSHSLRSLPRIEDRSVSNESIECVSKFYHPFRQFPVCQRNLTFYSI